MHNERFQRPLAPIVSGLVGGVSALLFASIISVYGYVSFVLPGDADVKKHGSGIYDMDILRVVADLIPGSQSVST